MWKQPKPNQPLSGSQKHVVQQRQNKAFDADTGQTYIETQVRISARQHSDWIGEFKTPALVKSSKPNDQGARSLLNMASTSTMKQLQNLGSEHFSVIPWTAAKGIWEQILASRCESFHAWRIFATCYPIEFAEPKYRYYLHLRQPSLSLEDYFRGLTSKDACWMTCLRISPKETRVADLVSLSNITNLALLDLSDGQISIDTKVSSFDERVVRTWAEVAKTEGAFKHLGILLLGWQEHVSTWLFKYLCSFPSLSHLIITDCPKIHQKNRKEWVESALDSGWEARHGKRSAKSLRPILNEPGFHLGAVSGLLASSTDILGEFADMETGNSAIRKPLLECWLGTPRPWSHILDEFPGTRTIIFDRTHHPSPKPHIAQGARHTDPIKRNRDQEQRSVEVRSPPPKRTPRTGGRLRARWEGASELLATFSKQQKD